jgi:signal transduction histidine kinase
VPQVQVESHANGNGRVVTRITDNGRGVPAALRRKIFGRFVRLGSELERSKQGTGLGLYIARTLVRRLRGEITLRSRSGMPGTTFEVELPGQALTADTPSD